MRRLMLCALAVIAAGLLGWLPATQKDVGDLLPVQALVVAVEDGEIVLDGGEDLTGRGTDWAAAMEDLRATAPGEAFFGAAGHVVLLGEAQSLLLDVLGERELRPAAGVYAGDGEIEAEGAAEFLEAHEGEVTLQDLQAAALEGEPLALPVLRRGADGRYRLEHG